MFEGNNQFSTARRRDSDAAALSAQSSTIIAANVAPAPYPGVERRSLDRSAALAGRGDDLALALKDFFASLDAAAGNVVLFGLRGDMPVLIFTVGANPAAPEDRERAPRPARRSKRLHTASTPLSWRESESDTSAWMTFEIPSGLDRHGHLVVSALFRDADDAVRDQAAERALLLLPLLATALRQWLAARTARQQATGYASAMNRHAVGTLILNREGTILFANDTAEAFLDAGDHLRRSGRSVRAVDLGSSLRLQVAIDHVASDVTMGISAVVPLPRPGELRPLMVTVLSPEARPVDPFDAAVILFVLDPDRDICKMIEPICAHYKLTRVETRLACLLAEGQDLDAAAESMHVKEGTARTYLKQIFMKTDVRRQSDLIRLLLASDVRLRTETPLELV